MNRKKTIVTPNLFILGVQKAGTTTLYNYLKEHDQIDFTNGKEPHIFSQKDFEEFDMIAPTQNSVQYSTDSSTSYFFLPKALERIDELSDSNTKYIFIFRNPVERAISAFYQVYKQKIYGTLGWYENRNISDVFNVEASNVDELKDEEHRKIMSGVKENKIFLEPYDNFEDSLWPFRYLTNSLYSERVKKILELNKKEQFLFLSQDQLRTDPIDTLNEIYDFLALKHLEMSGSGLRSNKTEIPKKDRLSNWVHYLFPYVRKVLPGNNLNQFYRNQFWAKPDKNSTLIGPHLKNIFVEDLRNLSELTGLDFQKLL